MKHDATSAATRARILEALRAIWREIQQQRPEVPPVEIVWSTGRRRKALPQHLHTGEWTGELAVADEQVATGVKTLVLSLLHEAVHGVAAARGVVVSSRNDRYHNARFRELAQDALGFTVEENSVEWGWSETTPPSDVVDACIDSKGGRDLAEALVGFTAETAPSPNLAVAICACTGAAARPIRIAAAKFELGSITCGVCRQDYALRDG